MPHECSVSTGKCIKSYTRIIPEKTQDNDPMTGKCWANVEGCHLCGSIGPMSSVSRYLLWQCGNAMSHTMAHLNRDQIQLEYHDKKLAILTCPRCSAMTGTSELPQYRCAGHSTATQTQADISWQYVISRK